MLCDRPLPLDDQTIDADFKTITIDLAAFESHMGASGATQAPRSEKARWHLYSPLAASIGVAALPKGAAVVETRGRAANQSETFKAPSGDRYANVPIAVLVDEYSASAAEIISGGNFHGEPLAISMDYLAIALSEIGNIRRGLSTPSA